MTYVTPCISNKYKFYFRIYDDLRPDWCLANIFKENFQEPWIQTCTFPVLWADSGDGLGSLHRPLQRWSKPEDRRHVFHQRCAQQGSRRGEEPEKRLQHWMSFRIFKDGQWCRNIQTATDSTFDDCFGVFLPLKVFFTLSWGVNCKSKES